jgi:hypothetical protein
MAEGSAFQLLERHAFDRFADTGGPRVLPCWTHGNPSQRVASSQAAADPTIISAMTMVMTIPRRSFSVSFGPLMATVHQQAEH